jgi:hypothetical protein
MRSSCSSQGRIRRRHVWRFVFPLIILVESGCPGALDAVFVFQNNTPPRATKLLSSFKMPSLLPRGQRWTAIEDPESRCIQSQSRPPPTQKTENNGNSTESRQEQKEDEEEGTSTHPWLPIQREEKGWSFLITHLFLLPFSPVLICVLDLNDSQSSLERWRACIRVSGERISLIS